MKISLEEIAFIEKHKDADVQALALQKSKFSGNIRREVVLNQISGLQKAKSKFPFLSQTNGFIFPIGLSVEQSSSEQTAKYKSEICEYSVSADLNGGMGIDSIFLAKHAQKHYYNELNNSLSDTFQTNLTALNISNIDITTSDAFEFIKNLPAEIDLIFFDPARRNSAGKKTYFLEDTLPNPLEIIKVLKSIDYKGKILIKTSPLLDISRAIKQLENITEIHIVSVNNECKELLFLIDFQRVTQIVYHIIDLTSKLSRITFSADEIDTPIISNPQKYLYEPNAGLYKFGKWGTICKHFNISMIAQNTHLFTSDNYIGNFQGRIFEIKAIVKPNTQNLLEYLPELKANISVRNYPYNVDKLRKSLKIKDGGNFYLFFATFADNSHKCIICKKL